MQDYEANDPDIRSPSPEPVYDAKTGLRMNTKEQRLKDRYYKERNRLITEVLKLDSTYIVRIILDLTRVTGPARL